MRKWIIMILSCTIFSACGQDENFFIGKTFSGITESICGDGSGYTTFLKISFFKDKALLIQETAPIQGKKYVDYQLTLAWTFDPKSQQLHFAKVDKAYSYQRMSFYLKKDTLRAKGDFVGIGDEINFVRN